MRDGCRCREVIKSKGKKKKKSLNEMSLFSAFVHFQIISNDISELQKNQATTVAKIAQYKRKLMDLSHRVLQVVSAFNLIKYVCVSFV